MKRSWMKRRPAKLDPAHKEATALARRSSCLLCGSIGSCVPAHFPRHRGSGGRFANDWDRQNWVPLCGEPGACHDFIDSRTGGVGPVASEKRERVRAALLIKAKEEWWAT